MVEAGMAAAVEATPSEGVALAGATVDHTERSDARQEDCGIQVDEAVGAKDVGCAEGMAVVVGEEALLEAEASVDHAGMVVEDVAMATEAAARVRVTV
eukprot:6830943-Prymnesium_polylepis.1